MTTSSTPVHQGINENELIAQASPGRRATGALFFSVFGSLWLLAAAYLGGWSLPHCAAIIAGLATFLVWAALSQKRRYRAELAAVEGLAATRKAARFFHMVNVGQWVAMFITLQVLTRLQLHAWQIPALLLIVGAHFLPLAWSMRNRAHWVTGIAMMLVAVIYPLASAQGPASPVGAFCGGIILWLSAAWAVRSTLAGMLGVQKPACV